MKYNGYHNKFVEKAISTQRKRNAAPKQAKGTTSPELINVSIPFIDRLSQALRRIAQTANVRYLFYTPRTLRPAYHIKDSMPATMLTHNVYSVKCQTCDAEYVGETKRAIAVGKKETTKTQYALAKR